MKKITAFVFALLMAGILSACFGAGQRDPSEAGPVASGTASVSEKTDEGSMDLTVSESSSTGETKTTETAETSSTSTETPQETTPEAETEPSVLRAAVTTLPEKNDPVGALNAEERSVFAELYTGLYFWDVNYKGEAELCLGIAGDWPSFSEDGLTATITLKSTFWSDGTPLTAQDFVNSFLAARSTLLGTERYEAFSFFETKIGSPFAEAKGENTLVIHLKRPCLYLADILSGALFLPVKKIVSDDSSEEISLFNGPFILNEIRENAWILDRNPFYFQADKVKYDRLAFDLITGSGNQYLAYKSGQVDVIDQIPESAKSRYDGTSSLVTKRLYAVTLLRFDGESSLFAEKTAGQGNAIREAINLLIDRQILKNDVWGEKTRLAETLVSPGISDGNGGIFEENRSFFDAKSTGRDRLSEAKELLKFAGYSFTDMGNGFFRIEPELTLNVAVSEESVDRRTVFDISEDLSFLGINVKILDPGEVADAELLSISADQDDAWSVLSQLCDEAGGRGFTGADENFVTLENMLCEAMAIADPDRRALALKDAEDLLFDTWMILPLYCENDSYLLSSGLTGVYETPFGVRRYLYAEKR